MDIFVDTSTLIAAMLRKIDVRERLADHTLTEIILIIPTCVLEELSRIGREGTRRGRGAKAALAYIDQHKHKNLKIIEVPSSYSRLAIDAQIIEAAYERGDAILSEDRGLAREARKRGIRVYTLRMDGTIGD